MEASGGSGALCPPSSSTVSHDWGSPKGSVGCQFLMGLPLEVVSVSDCCSGVSDMVNTGGGTQLPAYVIQICRVPIVGVGVLSFPVE